MFLVGCWSSSTTKPAPAVVSAPVISNQTRTCTEAAVGLESATRGVRDPDATIVEPMRARCADDAWPTSAIDCFATMREGELGKCAAGLADAPREHLFAVLGGGGGRGAIAVARARLGTLSVGIAECDQFVTAVAAVLDCERMPLDTRVELGNETAGFWDLPTHGLSADAQRRMAEVCGQSLAQLQQQASGVGCVP